jgi:thymidine kinase
VQRTHGDIGWIEVICGPMFSGKTEELIRRLSRAVYARQLVEAYKPRLDNRYATTEIVSHSQRRLEARPVQCAREILELVTDDVEVVGIDEAQFFDLDLIGAANQLADRGIRVIVAGLDQDFKGAPFEPIPDLLAVAESVTKVSAICMKCGDQAGRSQRLTGDRNQVVIGAAEVYEARCRRCHVTTAK